MSKWLKGLILGSSLCCTFAYADFLPPDQAFQFQAISTTKDRVELTWQIADGYYLYDDQFKVFDQQKPLKLTLPQPQEKDDPNFGLTQVHYGHVQTLIDVKPQQTFDVQWQGCAESGLCYPVQRATIHTDLEGLLPRPQRINKPQLLTTTEKMQSESALDRLDSTIETTEPAQAETEVIHAQTESELKVKSNAELVLPQIEQTVRVPTSTVEASVEKEQTIQPEMIQSTRSEVLGSQWNNDQFFFKLLSDQSIMLNVLIFLGLGILLAFLPCSLPLIPILSSILVQQHRGLRAAGIALAFVLGMAVVYTFMGLAVAQLGYSFQRWFQSPIFIGLFSILFILFALNLFGVFQLSLPQRWLQYLDQWQQKQQGGTLIGAALMGSIAALIVGPCMSAPLAGALLFVSQLNQPILAASYLFVLGLGLGVPLFIAAVFGAHYLPRPGIWMDRLKFSFGFVMLALAWYFARPLLAMLLYLIGLGSVLLAFAVYIIFKLIGDLKKTILKLLLWGVSAALIYGAGSHFYQAWQHSNIEQREIRLTWHQVNTANQLQQVLAQHQGQAVIIDVYADWCVACQPIEKELIPRSDVQNALQDVVRIKLDLTQYHMSQDELLKKWQILGPPTFIFLDQIHQEQRHLRLTGTFSAVQLLNNMQQLQGKTP